MDDELWLEIANAYVKLGDVQGNPADNNLGDWPAAIKSFQKAKGIYQRWAVAYPNRKPALVGLGDALSGFERGGTV